MNVNNEIHGTYDRDELRDDDDDEEFDEDDEDERELDDSRLDFCRDGASECVDRTGGLRRRRLSPPSERTPTVRKNHFFFKYIYFVHDHHFAVGDHDHNLRAKKHNLLFQADESRSRCLVSQCLGTSIRSFFFFFFSLLCQNGSRTRK